MTGREESLDETREIASYYMYFRLQNLSLLFTILSLTFLLTSPLLLVSLLGSSLTISQRGIVSWTLLLTIFGSFILAISLAGYQRTHYRNLQPQILLAISIEQIMILR